MSKRQNVRMLECQNVRMWSVRMSECQNVRMSECQLLSMLMSMSKCQMSKCQNVIMLRCQNVRMSGYQKFHFVDVSLVSFIRRVFLVWPSCHGGLGHLQLGFQQSALLLPKGRFNLLKISWCCGGRPQRSDRRTQPWREPWFSQLSQFQLSQLSQLFQLFQLS